jgi:His/Glu/Gln/Arg/opine family amino acid ABC transporter permease subunit
VTNNLGQQAAEEDIGLPYDFNFAPVFRQWPLFVQGVAMTIYVSTISMFIAVIWGMIIALARMAQFPPLRAAARAYVQLFRGIPLYVYILWLYYGVAALVGIRFAPVQAGVICLATLYGAYLAEIDRGALESIAKEQTEAAKSLGLTPFQTFKDVVLPQAIRTIIPPTTTMFAIMIMDSSLVSVIGVTELLRLMKIGASDTFRTMEFYTTGAVIYVTLVLIVTRMSAFLETKYQF